MALPRAASRKPPPRASTGFFGAEEAYGFGLVFSIVLLAALRIGLTWQRSSSTGSPSLFGLSSSS